MFNNFKKTISKISHKAKSIALAGASLLASGSAMALTEAQNTAVSGAFTSGQTSVSAVVAGVILVAATLTGLGIVYTWLKK